MHKRENIITTLLIGTALVASILFVVLFRTPSNSSTDADTQAVENLGVISMPTASIIPPSTRIVIPPITSTVIYQGTPVEVVNRRHILEGKSLQQIADYVVREVAPNLLGSHGPMQVRLVRPITREEVPQLGLGCLADISGIEEPPYILVILQGDFDLRGIPRPEPLAPGTGYQYSTLIIDVWAAEATAIRNSRNGAHFRQILNDPSLPEMTPEPPSNCPPHIPGNYPHGAVVYGTVFPTFPPVPTNTIPILPSPVPTQNP